MRTWLLNAFGVIYNDPRTSLFEFQIHLGSCWQYPLNETRIMRLLLSIVNPEEA